MTREIKKICYGATVVASALFWLGTIVAGVLADADGPCFNKLRFALFRNKTRLVYLSRMTGITPVPFTFAMWEFIYTWNLLWVTYCAVSACKPEKRILQDGRYISVNIFPMQFHVAWCVCSITHVWWLILWDRGAFEASLFVQSFILTSSVVTLGISHKATYRSGALLQYKHPWELWVARTLVQNGITMSVVWHFYLSLINVIILITKNAQTSSPLVSAFVLAIFGLCVLVWTVVELCVFDKWLRYTFTVYPTVLWCMVGVGIQHFYLWSPVFIISVAIFGFAFLAIIIRVPLTIWRSFINPLYLEQTLPHKVSPRFRQECLTTVL